MAERVYVVDEEGTSVELPPGAQDIDVTGPPGHVLYTDSGGIRRCTCGLFEDDDPE